MTALVLVRHGPTGWNLAGRVQGHSDVPLTDAARAWLATWSVPAELGGMARLASPLVRATETAEILFGERPATDPRLMEMAYGAWEGETVAGLRARLGEELAANEARGWHFRAPGGESPAMLYDRLSPLLAEIAAAGRDTVAVCHNGVIRAIHARAAGWDMTGRPPAKLREGCAHHFRLAADGTPALTRLNAPLAPAPFAPDGSAAGR